MFTLVQFQNGRFGLQNNFNNIILDRRFRTMRSALRYVKKFTRSLEKANKKLNQEKHNIIFAS